MAKAAEGEVLSVGGRDVKVSNPGKIYFPAAGITKIELVRYYVEVGEGALRGIFNRPVVLKRYVHGAAGEFFFQKRAPEKRPEWVTTVRLSFPSGRTADEIVATEIAHLAWMANLGCIDLNPHPVRADRPGPSGRAARGSGSGTGSTRSPPCERRPPWCAR